MMRNRCLAALGMLCLVASPGLAEHYAVLFSGGVEPAKNFERYYLWTNTTYWRLVSTLHFLPENIVVLAADGISGGDDQNLSNDENNPTFTDSNWSAITGNGTTVDSATLSHLESTLTGLPLQSRDTFLFWAYDHGGGDEGQPGVTQEEYLCGWGENIGDNTFAQDCAPLAAGRQAYVFGQCYAGGMLDRLRLDNGIGTDPGTFGCASTNHYEKSYSTNTTGFLQAFASGIATYRTTTEDLYQHAYANTPTATDGEGPYGTWADGVQHPWSIGNNYDLAVAEWMGWQNGSWTDPDNWTDQMEPNSDRTVRIRMNGSPAHPATVTSGENARQVRVCSGAELHIAGGGILTIGGDLQNDGGSVQVTNAMLHIDTGELDNTEAASSVSLANSAAYARDIHNAGSVGVGAFSLLHAYNDVNNEGAITVHDGGMIIVDRDLENEPAGTVTVENGSSWLIVRNDYLAHGTTQVTGGATLMVDGIMYVGPGGKIGGAQVDLTDSTLDVNGQLLIGVGHPGTLTATRSTADVFSLLAVGSADQGTLSVRGSTVTAMYLFVGDGSGSEGDLTLDVDGANVPYIKIGGATPQVIVGREGTGTVVHNAGWLTRVDPDIEHPKPPYPEVVIGDDQEGIGVYNFNHGEIRASNMTIGKDGTGMLVQRGGVAQVLYQLTMGAGSTGKGTYNVNGGSMVADVFELGRAGEGAVTQEEGLVDVHDLLRFATVAGSKGTYTLNGGALRVDHITNGSGRGYLRIDGGTLDLTGGSMDIFELSIGYASGHVGALNLAGKTVTAEDVWIGRDGQGAMTQTGGTTTINSKLLVGYGNSATLDQAGGDVSAGYVYLGYDAAGSGTYTLDGGTLTATNSFILGSSGSNNLFTQRGASTVTADAVTVGSGGTNNTYRQEDGELNVTSELQLGLLAGGQGAYELLGGVLRTDTTIVGRGGAGTFDQTGGEHKVAGLLTLGETGTGEYQMTDGKLETSGTVVGDAGTGTFNQTGGIHRITGDLTVGKSGAASSYTLNGPAARVTAQDQYVGHNATAAFTLDDGRNDVSQDLYLGHGAGANGTYNLNGGELVVGGTIYVGSGGGTGALNMNGGLLAIPGSSLLSMLNGGGMRAPLGGLHIAGGAGTVSGYGIIDVDVYNSGKLEAKGGTLTLKRTYSGRGNVSVAPGATLRLEADAELSGPVANNGDFRIIGGIAQLLGGMTGRLGGRVTVGPSAELEVSSDLGADAMAVSGGVRHLGGSTSLAGALRLDGTYRLDAGTALANARAEVDGGLAHDGGKHTTGALYVGCVGGTATYGISGGSLRVGDLHVGRSFSGGLGPGIFRIDDSAAHVAVSGTFTLYPTGLISAVPGSQIHMTGTTFNNYSTTPGNCADLRNVEFVFEGGAGILDPFEVAGLNQGSGEHGFLDNFVIGTVTIGGGDIGRLRLVDLFDNQPGTPGREALYVLGLRIGPGSYLDLNGFNLYYTHGQIDPGATVDLHGGRLVQMGGPVIPEPAALPLLALGLFALRRRRR